MNAAGHLTFLLFAQDPSLRMFLIVVNMSLLTLIKPNLGDSSQACLGLTSSR